MSETLSLSDLTPDSKNARRHNERNVAMIRDALQEVGAARSIVVDEQGNILAGNATAKAAAEAGIEQVQIVDADGSTLVAVRRSGLSNEEKVRLALFDNRSAELADWNDERLAEILAEDEKLLNGLFKDDELAEVLGDLFEPEIVDDPGAQVDKAAELQQKWGTALDQVWEVGDHRIVCGDCTDGAVVDAVMRGERAQLFATDPPYGCNAGNIGFTAQRDDIEAITKDDLEGREMQAFLETVFKAWIPHLRDNCAWYLWHPMLTQGYFAAAAAAAAADLIIHRQIIWRKEQFIFGRGDYHWRHELCFYGWRQGHRPPFYGERNQDTVWDIPWGVKRSVLGHPTAKPVELFAIPVRNHTKPGEICAEPFLGSGSQAVACQQLGRKCRGVEIEPRYVAVTLERLAGMGLNPELIK